MPQSGTPRNLARNAGNVHVPQPFFFVVDVAFLFQHAELSPHRRIVCFVGQLFEHFTDRGAFELIKNVHDLPLAPGQCMGLWLSLHHSSPLLLRV